MLALLSRCFDEWWRRHRRTKERTKRARQWRFVLAMSETVRAFAHGDERRERGDWRRELLSTAYIYHTWRPPRLQQHSSSATPFLELPPLFSSPRAPCVCSCLLRTVTSLGLRDSGRFQEFRASSFSSLISIFVTRNKHNNNCTFAC